MPVLRLDPTRHEGCSCRASARSMELVPHQIHGTSSRSASARH
jgi:hypothetical protein